MTRRAAGQGAAPPIGETCNRLSHRGRPAGVAARAARIAAERGCPPDLILPVGDHPGPNPKRHLAADDCVRAGSGKIHPAASTVCAGKPAAPDDATVAERVMADLPRIRQRLSAAFADRPRDAAGPPVRRATQSHAAHDAAGRHPSPERTRT